KSTMPTPQEQPVPDSKVTPALVDRVSERLAMGMPLNMALAGENLTRAEYKDALQIKPDKHKSGSFPYKFGDVRQLQSLPGCKPFAREDEKNKVLPVPRDIRRPAYLQIIINQVR
ncbi:MAG TPA: hypothetical protein VGY56_19495, partial [Verrucomicrobiae bacterium]|nr:hypothetical protein [Verrucomicrobiae bacterium]